MGQLTELEESTKKMAGLIGSAYFMGKIFGEKPDVEVHKALEFEARQVEKIEWSQLLADCGREMTARGDQIEKAGNYLTDLGL
jgi:hypothetical protein